MLRIQSAIYLPGRLNLKLQHSMSKTILALYPSGDAHLSAGHHAWSFKFGPLEFVCNLVLAI